MVRLVPEIFHDFLFFLIFYDFLRYCFQFFNGDKQHQRNQQHQLNSCSRGCQTATGKLPPHGYLPRDCGGNQMSKKSTRVAVFAGLIHPCCHQSKPMRQHFPLRHGDVPRPKEEGMSAAHTQVIQL